MAKGTKRLLMNYSFPLRSEVDQANRAWLAKLSGEVEKYISLDRPGIDSKGNPLSAAQADTILDRLIAMKEVTLKVTRLIHFSGLL